MFEQYVMANGFRKFAENQYYPRNDGRVTVTKLPTTVIIGLLDTVVTINNTDPEIAISIQKALSALL